MKQSTRQKNLKFKKKWLTTETVLAKDLFKMCTGSLVCCLPFEALPSLVGSLKVTDTYKFMLESPMTFFFSKYTFLQQQDMLLLNFKGYIINKLFDQCTQEQSEQVAMFIKLTVTNSNYNKLHRNKQKSLLGTPPRVLKVITTEERHERQSLLERYFFRFFTLKK